MSLFWEEVENFFINPPPDNQRPPSLVAKISSQKLSKSRIAGAASNAKKPGTGSKIDQALEIGGGMKMAEMRIQTDLTNLPDNESWFDIPPPDPNNLFLQEIEIVPPEGYWKNAKYKFRCNIPKDYPFSPPKLHCDTLIYHPNIDLSGNVCISILKVDGKPGGWSVQRSLNDVLFGIEALFTEPNVDDPLNFEAADMLAKQPEEFKKLVQKTLKGETVTVNKENRKFEKLL
eukprot:TRINITY_DN77_c0_g1_i5.p1 TRINITY_DN77_c0_g1~~TRINITY_DN77_c0_g1_i5.p1  ORF type:complete len:231 (+),score=49.99 TRINITY_DN77_c0_g1_i5:140-832(+)